MTNVVTFPGLGLEFDLNRVAFELFGRPIYWYGIIIVSGMLLATWLCIRWAKRFGFTEDHVLDLLLYAVPVALIAVRAYYVLFNLEIFKNPDGSLNWSAVFRYSDGGLAIYGAIISSILVVLIFCKVKHLSWQALADLGVHGLFIGQSIGRWGNFMNVEAYGAATRLPWRMCSPSIADYMLRHGYVTPEGAQEILTGTLGVHPTFFYESAWNAVGLLLVYRLGRKRRFDGQCFLFYLFWYGLGRFWIEGLRTDSLYFFGLELFGMPIRTSQMVAGISAIVAGVLLVVLTGRAKKAPKPLYVERAAMEQGDRVESPGEDISSVLLSEDELRERDEGNDRKPE